VRSDDHPPESFSPFPSPYPIYSSLVVCSRRCAAAGLVETTARLLIKLPGHKDPFLARTGKISVEKFTSH